MGASYCFYLNLPVVYGDIFTVFSKEYKQFTSHITYMHICGDSGVQCLCCVWMYGDIFPPPTYPPDSHPQLKTILKCWTGQNAQLHWHRYDMLNGFRFGSFAVCFKRNCHILSDYVILVLEVHLIHKYMYGLIRIATQSPANYHCKICDYYNFCREFNYLCQTNNCYMLIPTILINCMLAKNF